MIATVGYGRYTLQDGCCGACVPRDMSATCCGGCRVCVLRNMSVDVWKWVRWRGGLWDTSVARSEIGAERKIKPEAFINLQKKKRSLFPPPNPPCTNTTDRRHSDPFRSRRAPRFRVCECNFCKVRNFRVAGVAPHVDF